MRKIIVFTAVILCLGAGLCFAQETITFTTYYPSPAGVYKNLTTTEDTYLATDTGSVGIGTTSPSRKLHIKGDNEGLRIEDGSSSVYYDIYRDDPTGYLYFWGNQGTYSGYHFVVNNTTDVLTILNSGNVGIGTASPSSGRLQVQGGTDDAQVHIRQSSANNWGIKLVRLEGDGAPSLFFSDDVDNTFEISKPAGTNDLYLSGKVGIGRTPATNKLEVEGDASKSAAGDWLANSDIRIKTNIQDIQNALEVINKLHPVKFHYSEEYRTQHSSIKDNYYYNFIAQEFQEVFPDSVKDDGEGFLQIDTHNIKPYLVAAMQELSKQVKELRAENEALKKGIEALEARLRQ